MTEVLNRLRSLTAGDVMSRGVLTLQASMPLPEASARLIRSGVRGAPVVDDQGRCVGVLSVSDLARWASRRAEQAPSLPRSCSYQELRRGPGGAEITLCTLPAGVCSAQRNEREDEHVSCAEPHSVCTEWQVVQVESLPPEDVRHYMTTDVVTVEASTSLTEVARIMLQRSIHRVFVLDEDGSPLGVVSTTEILAAVAAEYVG